MGSTSASVDSKFLAKWYCHCNSCKELFQAAVSACAAFPVDSFKVDKGELKALKRDDMKHYMMVCSSCFIPLFARNDKFNLEKVGIPEIRRCNSKEVAAKCQPTMHLFYGERDLDIADDLPKFKDLPAGFGGSDILCEVDGTPKK